MPSQPSSSSPASASVSASGSASAREAPDGLRAPGSALRWIVARLLLALGSFAFTGLALELAVRFALVPPAPAHLRDGIYATRLGKVNGFDTRTVVDGEPLPAAKRPSEIRIAAFGESTVQGSPYELFGSPVTMLHDQLKTLYPERDFTVMNMGRGSGYLIDSYYFLVTLRRFHPDFVILYQGANDVYESDEEMCLPATHPGLHRAWRWLVLHSRLAWSVRALGPGIYARMKGKSRMQGGAGGGGGGGGDHCNARDAFRGWARILIETAEDMGARVVVVTPVSNPLRWAETDGQFGAHSHLRLAQKDDAYKRLVGCVLTPGCDVGALFARAFALNSDDVVALGAALRDPRGLRAVLPSLEAAIHGRRYPKMIWVEPRQRIWREEALSHGARFFDFEQYITDHYQGGLEPLLFIDEMHLTFNGLWLLAWQWTRAIAADLDGRELTVEPKPLARGRYLPEVTRNLHRGEACIYLRTTRIFFDDDMALVGAVQLRLAIESEVEAPGALARTRSGLAAQLAAGYLRVQVGLPSGLPERLAPLLPGFDMQAFVRELSADVDCGSVGGKALEPFISDPTKGRPPEQGIGVIAPGDSH